MLITAAAGYGKTTALEAERPLGGAVCTAVEALEHGLPRAPWIGVDAVEETDVDRRRELVRLLGGLPPQVGICLAGRTPWPRDVRDGLRGPYVERGPADLALSPYAIARLLAEEYAVGDPEAASRVVEATGGWPALVHFAADVLARHPDADLLEALTERGSAAATWVRSAILADLPKPARRLLTVIAGLGPVTLGVCRRVAERSRLVVDDLPDVVERLGQQGVLLPATRPGGTDVPVFVPVIGRILAAEHAPTDDADLLRAAAETYEGERLPFHAVRAYARAGAHRDVERLLVERGGEMVRGGDARGVAKAAEALPFDPTPALRRTHADALRRLGDGGAARRVLAPLLADPDPTAGKPGLATLLATALYTEGDLTAALQALDRVEPDAAGVDLTGVEWHACRVQLLAMLGRRDEAQPLAARTLELAEALGDPLALAAAHLASSRTTVGARKEAHLEGALRAANQVGDVVTAALVRVNQSHLLLASARYAEAVVVGREALRLSALSSPTGRLSAALHNLSEALTQTGGYDEARWQLQRAVAHGRRLGPGRTALGLYGLAEIHRQLGRDEQARAAYEEAVGLARASGELQVLVPALAGLARLLAAHDDPSAVGTATEAEVLATPALRPYALVALGWVAYAQGARAQAAARAREAAQLAGSVAALDLLAEALELLGLAAAEANEGRSALTKALAVWRDGGARPRAARVELLLGRLPGADGTARSRARDAARLLQRLGVVGIDGRPVTDQHLPAPVGIQVLGGFAVQIAGQPVPLPAWRSRQARTLVRILAARRGRPLTRDHLCELLWPDDDPAKTGHRLSVLLATVRGVLDPGKAWPPDHFIAAEPAGLRLDLSHVALDADGVLHDAAVGAELMEVGDDDRAREILCDVDARYLGDAFEDDLGEEWADGFREEARGAWLRSLRRLATLRRREGRFDDAQGLLLRLLAVDPYDEQVHGMLVRTLTRAGRHGEARRAFLRWRDAMAAIDAPLPDPGVLRPSQERGRPAGRATARSGTPSTARSATQPAPRPLRPPGLVPRPAL